MSHQYKIRYKYPESMTVGRTSPFVARLNAKSIDGAIQFLKSREGNHVTILSVEIVDDGKENLPDILQHGIDETSPMWTNKISTEMRKSFGFSHGAAKHLGLEWESEQDVQVKLVKQFLEVITTKDDYEKIQGIGDCIFILIDYLRWMNVEDPEDVLYRTNLKFKSRIWQMERIAREAGKELIELDDETMIDYWHKSKSMVES